MESGLIETCLIAICRGAQEEEESGRGGAQEEEESGKGGAQEEEESGRARGTWRTFPLVASAETEDVHTGTNMPSAMFLAMVQDRKWPQVQEEA